jgi:hypothetical protein
MLPRLGVCQPLELGLPSLQNRTRRNKFTVIYKLPIPRYFVIAAETD